MFIANITVKIMELQKPRQTLRLQQLILDQIQTDHQTHTGLRLENRQWGFTDLINTGSAGAFYFPVAFKNNCLITLTSPVGYAVNTNGGYIVGGNTSSAAVELFNWGPISAACKIIALGK